MTLVGILVDEWVRWGVLSVLLPTRLTLRRLIGR